MNDKVKIWSQQSHRASRSLPCWVRGIQHRTHLHTTIQLSMEPTYCEVTDCCNEASIRVRALKWDRGTLKRSRGDHLCDSCHKKLKRQIADDIPHPSRSRPAAYVVARASQQSLLERDTAVTLAVCFGRLREAAALKETMPADKLIYVARWLQPTWLNRNTCFEQHASSSSD